MISERHPLLVAGAGQNALMLPDEAVVPYCDVLGDRLSRLGAALQEDQAVGLFGLALYTAQRGLR